MEKKLPRPAFEVLRKARETILAHRMLRGGEKVILAVSGGPDSLVLLDVMFRLREDFRLGLEVFHVDHGLRPGCEVDAAYVNKVAAGYGLPFSCCKAEVRRTGPEGESLSPEEAARAARYRAFEKRLRESRADRVALGHQADDRVETMLMRLCGGAGPRALASSVPPLRGPFFRPLIRVWRSEIEEYLPSLPFPPLEDPSNRDLSIPRNRIRHVVIPFLAREVNPGVKYSLLRALDLLDEGLGAKTGLGAEIGEGPFLLRSPAEEGGSRYLPMDVYLARDRAGRNQLLHALLLELGVRPSYRLVKDLGRNVCEGRAGNRMDLPGGIVAVNEYDRVLFLREGKEKPSAPGSVETVPEEEGEYGFPLLSMKLYLRFEEAGGTASYPADAWEALLDRELLDFPLRLRRLMPGDRFRPLGAPGSRKVRDFLIDAKVPRRLRGEILALLSGERIAWLPGLRISDEFKVTERTRRSVRLRAEPLDHP